MEQMEKMYCDHEREHESAVLRAKEGLLLDQDVEKMARMFSVLSDPIRLRIVLTLMEGSMCVFHLLQVCETTKSAMSHQLRILKDYNIVKAKRYGKNVEYSIMDGHIQEMVKMGITHLACKHEE